MKQHFEIWYSVAALTAPPEAECTETPQKKGEDPQQLAWRAMQLKFEPESKSYQFQEGLEGEMFHPGEMNPRYCAGEKHQQWSQGFHLNRRSFAVDTVKRQLAQVVIEVEVLKQTVTLQRQHWKSADYLPVAVVAVAVEFAGSDDDADY